MPARVREDDGSLHLALRDAPVPAQQALDLGPRQQPIAVLLVKRDRPGGGAPGADENRLGSERLKMGEERFADAFAPLARAYVGVADQRDVAAVLDAHDADQPALACGAPKGDAVGDLGFELLERHAG